MSCKDFFCFWKSKNDYFLRMTSTPWKKNLVVPPKKLNGGKFLKDRYQYCIFMTDIKKPDTDELNLI